MEVLGGGELRNDFSVQMKFLLQEARPEENPGSPPTSKPPPCKQLGASDLAHRRGPTDPETAQRVRGGRRVEGPGRPIRGCGAKNRSSEGGKFKGLLHQNNLQEDRAVNMQIKPLKGVTRSWVGKTVLDRKVVSESSDWSPCVKAWHMPTQVYACAQARITRRCR